MKTKQEEIKERLRRFLEINNNTKLINTDDGTLKMHIKLSKSKNDKIKSKIINFMLLRLDEKLFSEAELSERNAVICEFLLEELEKYVATAL